jgi:large subunit ribosomal protein L6e
MVKKYDWYPADDVKTPFNRHTPRAPKIRKSIAPGQVLILLSGRFRGKRVVFLKQLKSGLLCVTGPYKINGVPVKRVNQVYTMTTSAKVDLKGIKLDDISDETFKKEHAKKTRSHKFFESEAPAKKLTDARKKLQKDVDTTLMKNINDEMMKKYLNARFTLTKHSAPHAMKF